MMKWTVCAALALGMPAHFAIAAEPAKSSPSPAAPKHTHYTPVFSKDSKASEVAATAGTTAKASGRKAVEAILQQPAQLDFGDRKTAKIGEILSQLREKHQLSIRLDMPTLSAMFGEELFNSGPNYEGATPVALRGPRKISPHSAVVKSAVTVEPINFEEPANKKKQGKKGHPASRKMGEPGYATTPDAKYLEVAPLTASPPPVGPETSKPNALPEPIVAPDARPYPTEKPESPVEKKPAEKQDPIAQILNFEVNIATVDVRKISVETALRLVFDSVPSIAGAALAEEMPLPILITKGFQPDFLVEDDGLLITTRMEALSRKETRVYSIKALKEIPSEQLVKVIRNSVRPWSWRPLATDAGDSARAAKVPTAALESIAKAGVQLVAAELGATVTTSSEDEGDYSTQPKKIESKAQTSTAEDLAALGEGMIALANAGLSAIEMIHHAEFPVGTIQVLPGKLVVTQSQAAHREISNLLKQLSEE